MFFALQPEDPNFGALHCQPRQPARSGGAVSKTTKTTLNHKKYLENFFVATFYEERAKRIFWNFYYFFVYFDNILVIYGYMSAPKIIKDRLV